MRNSEFITGKVPITEEEVRAISISKLNLVNAKNLIDIGAGTGSVSVEAAYNYPNLKVISIEKNDDALTSSLVIGTLPVINSLFLI